MKRALLIWFCILVPLAAYTPFDEVIEVNPTWSPLPVLDGDSGKVGASRFRLRLLSAQRVRIELRNAGTMPLTIAVRLPSYQVDEPEVIVQAPAHGEAFADIRVRFADRLCTESEVAFTRITVGETAVVLRPFIAPPVPPTARAYAVATTWEHPGFRGSAVAYSLAASGPESSGPEASGPKTSGPKTSGPKTSGPEKIGLEQVPPTTLDLRLLNRSGQSIHAEFRILGWQSSTAPSPRLHLLPGIVSEVVVPIDSLIERHPGLAHAAHAAVALWAVRVGDDRGPSMGEGADDLTAFTALDDPWKVVAFGEPTIAGFNPCGLCWRFTDHGIALRNRTRVAIGARLNLVGGLPSAPFAVALAPLSSTEFPLPEDHGSNVVANAPTVDGVPVTVLPLTIAVAPVNSLPVRPRWPDDRFNPLTLVAATTQAIGDQAQVIIVNRSAITVHADWHLRGFQRGMSNPRLHLASGAAITVTVPVNQTDALLPLAQVAVWNVRLGPEPAEGQGAVWCVPLSP